MAEDNIYTLKIDEEFRHLIPPLSQSERKQLEENIINDGCREALCVWNKTILDGHNRYEICTRLQISFKILYVFIKSREEAIAWICANQLGRRNITIEARRYLIGKRYEMEKIIGAHNAVGTNQYVRKEARSKMYTEPLYDESYIRTRERLGKEYHLSPASISKYSDYTKSLDVISKFEPQLLQNVMSGRVKISQENIISLSRLPPTEIRRICVYLLVSSQNYSDTRVNIPKRIKADRRVVSDAPPVSVKSMPVYDPDAEVLSLALTIPSWISSINRTKSTANLREISKSVRLKLEEELTGLKSVAEAMLFAVKEEI